MLIFTNLCFIITYFYRIFNNLLIHLRLFSNVFRSFSITAAEIVVSRGYAKEIENFTYREPSARELRKDFRNSFAEVSETEYYAKQDE